MCPLTFTLPYFSLRLDYIEKIATQLTNYQYRHHRDRVLIFRNLIFQIGFIDDHLQQNQLIQFRDCKKHDVFIAVEDLCRSTLMHHFIFLDENIFR
jgi:hypothetical protein